MSFFIIILDCNDQIFLEQYETQHESAESTESDARYRKCIIRVPVNRTVRIKFKCSDGKDMHFEAGNFSILYAPSQ